MFEAEKAMLERHGHEVEIYTRHSDEIRGDGRVERVETCRLERELLAAKNAKSSKDVGRVGGFRKLWGMIKGALCTVGNPFAARDVARKCREFKPDVVHFHNTFPLISPLAVWAASKYAPVVMTLHNYRTACAAGVPTRDGKVCSLCLDKKCIWDGVRYRCYRGSLLATLPLAINIAMYRKCLWKWISKVIALTDFQRENLGRLGWSYDRVVIKPNFVIESEFSVALRKCRSNSLLYVGRLSSEKGVMTMLRAWKSLSCETRLLIVGDGDLRKECEELATGVNVEFLGNCSNSEVRRLMRESLGVIISSECWEGLPITLVESLSEGTPLVVSNIGPLPRLIKENQFGEVFEAGNVEACAAAIERLLERKDYDEMCAEARRVAKMMYSEESNYEQLMKIYESVKYA